MADGEGESDGEEIGVVATSGKDEERFWKGRRGGVTSKHIM